MDTIITTSQSKMQKVIDVVRNDLSTIRTGRAAPSLVENLSVVVYGGAQRLKIVELATITSADNQTLLITPFDGSIIGEIKKGILEANIGLNPTIDSNVIRIAIPPLSEERRKELIHLMKQKLENGKIMIRQIRHEAMGDMKKDEMISEDEKFRIEKEIQKVTDEFIGGIEQLGKQKEDELLRI